ncbi:MAG: hypothetical protein K2J81_09750, partial [Treponemataceae bacterium]|nr:hypothetical protein [Treponemataceae bacterium]
LSQTLTLSQHGLGRCPKNPLRFRAVRKTALAKITFPQDAESRPDEKHFSARRGKPTEPKSTLPHGAESRPSRKPRFRMVRKADLTKSTFPYGTESHPAEKCVSV